MWPNIPHLTPCIGAPNKGVGGNFAFQPHMGVVGNFAFQPHMGVGGNFLYPVYTFHFFYVYTFLFVGEIFMILYFVRVIKIHFCRLVDMLVMLLLKSTIRHKEHQAHMILIFPRAFEVVLVEVFVR